jgi:sulfatase modifying factor 1
MRAPLIALLLGFVAATSLPAQEAPPGMILIPAGSFTMGSSRGNYDEAPVHTVSLSAFYIDRYEVTNAAFAEFVRESAAYDSIRGSWFRYSAEGCVDVMAHYEARYGIGFTGFLAEGAEAGEVSPERLEDAARWRSALAGQGAMLGEGSLDEIVAMVGSEVVKDLFRAQARFPVRGVTWQDAEAYAEWAGKRLPTEAEWEKAARGPDRRVYPWGSTWDPARCRINMMDGEGPVEVGSYPRGASPYGCLDMAGNVWEWVADWYGETYYADSRTVVNPRGPEGLPHGELPWPTSADSLLRSGQQGRESDTRKVMRGGGWAGPENQGPFNARCARRMWSNPTYWHPDVGFRCVKDVDD